MTKFIAGDFDLFVLGALLSFDFYEDDGRAKQLLTQEVHFLVMLVS